MVMPEKHPAPPLESEREVEPTYVDHEALAGEFVPDPWEVENGELGTDQVADESPR